MVTKKFLPISNREAHSAIGPIYPIDAAAWVWHPEQGVDAGLVGSRTQLTTRYPTAPAFVRFERTFRASRAPLVIHVSADQRFELLLDGLRVARGPDKGDVERWPFATYEIRLTPGRHKLAALVWWLGDRASMAQMTWRGGFILKADGAYHAQLTTGIAAWRAATPRCTNAEPLGAHNHLWQLPTYQSAPSASSASDSMPGPWAPSITTVTSRCLQ